MNLVEKKRVALNFLYVLYKLELISSEHTFDMALNKVFIMRDYSTHG
jgi:hypothetical protein